MEQDQQSGQDGTQSNLPQGENNNEALPGMEEGMIQTTTDVLDRLKQVKQDNALEWSASEYIEHEKGQLWFVGLGVIALALLVLAIFIIKEYTFAALIVVMTIAIVIWAKRPASEMHYTLTVDTISINEKHFLLKDFRAFGILQEGALYYAVLIPNKRFAPGVNVYFPHELGEQIVDVLGSALPMQDIKPDIIDNLTNRLNF